MENAFENISEQIPVGHQQLGRKSAALWVAAVLWLPLGSAEWVGWAGLLASESLGWLRCIPLQLVLVAVAVEMSVAQMFKLHLRLLLQLGVTAPFLCPALDAA